MSQESVGPQATECFPGALCDSSEPDIRSYTSEEASLEIPFGTMVRQGTDDKGALTLEDQDNSLIGVVVHSHAHSKPTELGDTGLKPKAIFAVLRRGRLWVQPEESVAPGDEVHVRCIAGMGETPGTFRGSFDSTDTLDVSAFCRWLTTGDENTPAQLEVDMSNAFLAEAY